MSPIILRQKGGTIDAAMVIQALNWGSIELYGRCIIEGDLVFSSDVNSDISIKNCSFNGEVNFNSVCFNKDIDFSGSIFNEKANFGGSRFKECVKFVDAYFMKSAHFDCTIFYKNVDLILHHSMMMFHLMMQDSLHLDITKSLNLIMRYFKVQWHLQILLLKAIII